MLEKLAPRNNSGCRQIKVSEKPFLTNQLTKKEAA